MREDVDGVGFRSIDEVTTAAVHDRMLQTDGNVYSDFILREVEEGLADVEAGCVFSIEEVFDPLLARLERSAEEQCAKPHPGDSSVKTLAT